ncbi:MAG: ABC transporter substrate-binding protein [Gammaproteobacteria bacterium]|nr:ABC transporter substrate-binding protein [Gammaproteobacteria bacterium]
MRRAGRSRTAATLARCLGVLALGVLVTTGALAAGPAQPVERLHGKLLEIMRNAHSLGYAGRRDAIAPVIEQTFDLEFVARLSLGSHWSDLDAQQRARFVAAFGELSKATYAARFDGYSGQTFETISVVEARRGRMLVRTLLKTQSGAEDVRLDYLLHQADGEWQIVNVIADGISDLGLKRADYGAVMSAQGFDALLEKLEQQARDYASGAGS